MRVKRILEITVETHRVLVIRGRGQQLHAWCRECGGQVEMVSAEQAARRAGMSVRWVCEQIEAGRLHFFETPGKDIFICLNSLPE